jgi:hypothetical protein
MTHNDINSVSRAFQSASGWVLFTVDRPGESVYSDGKGPWCKTLPGQTVKDQGGEVDR